MACRGGRGVGGEDTQEEGLGLQARCGRQGRLWGWREAGMRGGGGRGADWWQLASPLGMCVPPAGKREERGA